MKVQTINRFIGGKKTITYHELLTFLFPDFNIPYLTKVINFYSEKGIVASSNYPVDYSACDIIKDSKLFDQCKYLMYSNYNVFSGGLVFSTVTNLIRELLFLLAVKIKNEHGFEKWFLHRSNNLLFTKHYYIELELRVRVPILPMIVVINATLKNVPITPPPYKINSEAAIDDMTTIDILNCLEYYSELFFIFSLIKQVHWLKK
ncbi:hypothetical protein AL387_gp184 [Salmon gill poxvirus]|uniref:Uncharacterized protein n=1 Tax=Salmon gill poxvirus TaxID=1680908 RepID=A0A0H4XWS7_9POXV|nr:hypothetical protein AL387_gp184 [Salmon gill poxvirus]AKR04308.1 hypothetical protein SGPV184 [Salmon gill poxvirus]